MKKGLDFYASLVIIAEKGSKLEYNADERSAKATRNTAINSFTRKTSPTVYGITSFSLDGLKVVPGDSVSIESIAKPIACWTRKGKALECKTLDTINDLLPSNLIPMDIHDEMERRLATARQGLQPLFPYMNTPHATELELLMKDSFSEQAERYGLQEQLGSFYGAGGWVKPLSNASMASCLDALEKILNDVMKPASSAVLVARSRNNVKPRKKSKEKATRAESMIIDNLINFNFMTRNVRFVASKNAIEDLVKKNIDDDVPVKAYNFAWDELRNIHGAALAWGEMTIKVKIKMNDSDKLSERKAFKLTLQRIPLHVFDPNFNAEYYFSKEIDRAAPSTFIERMERVNHRINSVHGFTSGDPADVIKQLSTAKTFYHREDNVQVFLHEKHRLHP